MDTSFETIHQSHLFAGDAHKLNAYYADWAPTYDEDVQSQHYAGPSVMGAICSMLATAYINVEPERLAVLDAGCWMRDRFGRQRPQKPRLSGYRRV